MPLIAFSLTCPKEWCEDNDVPFLWPFKEQDDVGLLYDAKAHRITVVPKDQAKVVYKSFSSSHFTTD